MSGVTQIISSQNPQDEAPVITKLGFKTYGFADTAFGWQKRRRKSSDHIKKPRRSKISAKVNENASSESESSMARTFVNGSDEEAIDSESPPKIRNSSEQSSSLTESLSPSQSGNALPIWSAEITKSGMSLKRQASELTSFLSRVKYLYDESESKDAIPLATSSSSSPAFAAAVASSSSTYSDQRALIKAQADRVRNQLDMKFSAMAFGSQLDHMGDTLDSSKPHYNPLRTIRDRKDPQIRPHLPKHPQKMSIWQIPIAELTQDLRWRFNQERLVVHKRHRNHAMQQEERSNSQQAGNEPENLRNSRKGSIISTDEQVNALEAVDQNHQTEPETEASPRFHYSTSEGEMPSAADSLRGWDRRRSSSDNQFSNSLPRSNCAELIDRLRSAHDGDELAIEDESSGENSLSKVNTHGSLMTNYDLAGIASSAGSVSSSVGGISGNQSSEDTRLAKPRFCRNSASVADTWNRLYKPRQYSSNAEFLTASGGGRRAPSVHSNNSSRMSSRRSSYSSDTTDRLKGAVSDVSSKSTENDRIPLTRSTSSDIASTGARSDVPSKVNAPVLTLTSENGNEVLLDSKSSARRRSSNAPLRKVPSPLNVGSSSALVGSDEWMGEQFGSLNQDAVRRNPLEKKCFTLDSDLRYLIAFYTTALHRARAKEVLRPCNDLESLGLRFPVLRLSDSLRNATMTDFLNYLRNVENALVARQQELDASVATPLDGLRVATDLMVSEVNMTLNRQIREVSSRMDRLTSQRGGCAIYMTTLYCLIEYTVTFVMWAIWCFVTVVRLILCPIKGMRFICNNLIIA